jgi:hypothetical protein
VKKRPVSPDGDEGVDRPGTAPALGLRAGSAAPVNVGPGIPEEFLRSSGQTPSKRRIVIRAIAIEPQITSN